MDFRNWRIGLRIKALVGLMTPLAILFFLLTAANERYLYREITNNYHQHIGRSVDIPGKFYRTDTERDNLIRSLRSRSIKLMGLGLLLLSGIVFFGLDHSFLAPIHQLRQTAMAMEKGRFALPATVNHNDELGDLSRAIVSMTQKLNRETQALESRVGELTLLYNISKVTSSALNLDQALEIMLKSAVKVTEATSGFIMLYGPEGASDRTKLTLKASLGIPDKVRKALISRDIAEFVANSRGPLLLVGDITKLGFRQQKEFKDAIYAPIKFAEDIIGVISLINKQTGNFIKKDLQLLLTLANQASGVIHSARLFEDLQASYFSTIQALAAAIDAKDPYTRGHSGRVVHYSQFIAERMGCSQPDIQAIKIAAYLHDIGKIGIDEQILLKKGKLTSREYGVVKNHPGISAKILAGVAFLKKTIPMVEHHHEHYDGGGYPDGLAAEGIPLGARIIAVADAYDAMTTDRPYRRALGHKKACDELFRQAGIQFDPAVVRVFIENIDECAVGIEEETVATFS